MNLLVLGKVKMIAFVAHTIKKQQNVSQESGKKNM